MAKDFGVAPENLHFIEQVNYHLDLFLRAGPKQSLFLINFALCKDLFEALTLASDSLSLSEIDREHLQRYLATAGKLDQELGPLLQEVEKQSWRQVLPSSPSPAISFTSRRRSTRNFPCRRRDLISISSTR